MVLGLMAPSFWDDSGLPAGSGGKAGLNRRGQPADHRRRPRSDDDVRHRFALATCWGLLVGCRGPWPARIGASGFSDRHHEGDGTTPTGAYGLGPVMYGNAPDPGVRYLYHDLVCGDWWDGDPGSATYNTFQHVPCLQTPPFAGNSEALWQQPQAYSSFAVVQYYAARVPARAPLSSSTPTRGRQRPAASPCRAVTSIACCTGSVQPAHPSS